MATAEIVVTEAMIEAGFAQAVEGSPTAWGYVRGEPQDEYRAMFALDPTVAALRAANEALIADVERAYVQGWTEAAKRLRTVAAMHSNPAIATAYRNAAEILDAVNGKRDMVQPETPTQIAAQGQGDTGDEQRV